jgi:hypothetical protein
MGGRLSLRPPDSLSPAERAVFRAVFIDIASSIDRRHFQPADWPAAATARVNDTAPRSAGLDTRCRRAARRRSAEAARPGRVTSTASILRGNGSATLSVRSCTPVYWISVGHIPLVLI